MVPQKIFKVVLPYGRGGHLGYVKKQTFAPLTHRGSTQNLALIDQAVLEKMIETVVDYGRRSMVILKAYQ